MRTHKFVTFYLKKNSKFLRYHVKKKIKFYFINSCSNMLNSETNSEYNSTVILSWENNVFFKYEEH